MEMLNNCVVGEGGIGDIPWRRGVSGKLFFFFFFGPNFLATSMGQWGIVVPGPGGVKFKESTTNDSHDSMAWKL